MARKPRHSYIMLKTGRFAEFRAALGDQLITLDGRFSKARNHMISRHGWGAFLRLAFSWPAAPYRAMAQANIARKQARLGRVFLNPVIRLLYIWRKAQHARLVEVMLRDIWDQAENPVGVIYNGTNVPDSVLEFVAPGDRRIYIENGYFDGTIQVDPKGINGFNSLPREAAFYRRYQPDFAIPAPQLNIRLAKHAEHAAKRLPVGAVFVPFQVDSDMQITRLSPWVKSMDQFYRLILEIADRLPMQTFVIKEHPMTRNPLCDRVANHPRILFQNGRDTRDLIRECAGVLTINSTVGIEALALGRRVIMLGEACYRIPGLVQIADTVDELERALQRLPAWTPDAALRNNFLHYVRTQFLFGDVGHPIDADLPERLLWLRHRRHEDALPPLSTPVMETSQMVRDFAV